MPKTRTATLEQADLFGAPVAVGVVELPVASPAAPAPRRKVHRTQREGHDRVRKKKEGPTLDERVHWEIKANGALGRSRQEISDRTGIPINSVCGAVDRLMKAGKVFEPVIGYEGTQAIHMIRERRKIIVDSLYTAVDWLAVGRRVDHRDTAA